MAVLEFDELPSPILHPLAFAPSLSQICPQIRSVPESLNHNSLWMIQKVYFKELNIKPANWSTTPQPHFQTKTKEALRLEANLIVFWGNQTKQNKTKLNCCPRQPNQTKLNQIKCCLGQPNSSQLKNTVSLRFKLNSN